MSITHASLREDSEEMTTSSGLSSLTLVDYNCNSNKFEIIFDAEVPPNPLSIYHNMF